MTLLAGSRMSVGSLGLCVLECQGFGEEGEEEEGGKRKGGEECRLLMRVGIVRCTGLCQLRAGQCRGLFQCLGLGGPCSVTTDHVPSPGV